MNNTKAAKALDLIAEGLAELSLALLEQPGRVPSASPASTLDPLPPLTDDDAPPSPDQLLERVVEITGGEVVPAGPTPDTALGRCPVHDTPWTVKPGGISKNNKPYKAFWKCAARDGDEFCNEKPIPAWANSHPPERSMVSA